MTKPSFTRKAKMKHGVESVVHQLGSMGIEEVEINGDRGGSRNLIDDKREDEVRSHKEQGGIIEGLVVCEELKVGV